MNQWWVDDLPLPLPHTTYKWARDHDMLVSFHTTMFWKRLKNKSPQDQLSMPAAMALNYCCTAACIRDYIKQGLNISCLDYKYVPCCQNILFTTSCNYLRQGPGCPSWGSLGQSRLLLRSWPNQCKATGGPQKVSSCIKTFLKKTKS